MQQQFNGKKGGGDKKGVVKKGTNFTEMVKRGRNR
tara:strand:+ start:1475 stop:1579 length:105 start_codon:yes stop_codon:yes gene_type:complete